MLKKSIIVCSIAVAFFANAQDASNITNTINVYSNGSSLGSSKFNSMVGSTSALGGDGTSLMNNPAGLGVAISGNASGTLLVNNYNNQSKLNGSAVDYNNTIADGNFNGISSFQLLTETPWKFVNIGVNYTSENLDNYVESPGNTNIKIQKNLLDSNNNPVIGNLAYEGHAYNRVGSVSKMSFGLGANYDNRLYFGLGINLHGSELEQYDTAVFGLDLDNSSSEYSKQYTPFSETGAGFSANIGVIGKINKVLRLGTAIESPTFWNIDRIYSEYYFDSNNDVFYENLAETRTLTTPMKGILSAALVPSKNFSVNLDYTIGLTRPVYKEQGEAEVELNDFFKNSYKAMSEIKLGAEYRIKKLRLRGGYAFAKSPLDNISLSTFNSSGVSGNSTLDQLFVGDRKTLGFGLGYDWKSFFIDAAYQKVESTYNNPFLAGYEAYGTGYYSGDFDANSTTSAVSEVINKRNNFSFTLGWKF